MSLSQETVFRPLRWSTNLFGSPAVILLYHRVLDLVPDPQQMAVHPDNFYEQVAFLKKRYHVATTEEFTDHLKRKKKFSRGTVLITFDDGYRDNFQYALPILESLDAQALFFITTSFLDTGRELWWDDLERILLGTKTKPHALALHIGQEKHRYDTSNEKTLWEIYALLQERLRLSHPDLIASVIKQLQLWAALPEDGREEHRLMNFQELKQMGCSPAAAIGCHTHRHAAIGVLEPGEQRQEILQSKQVLEGILDKPVRHFSYPFGSRKMLGSRRYYNRDSLRIVKELELDMACANYYGQVHRWSNPYALPRILVRNWTKEVFQDKMKQYFRS